MPGLVVKQWCPFDVNEPLPNNLVIAGVDAKGSALYAGRAYHSGDLLPAKVYLNHPTYGTAAHIGHGRFETPKRNFELLLSDGQYFWRPEENGKVPIRALEIGYTVDGERLYMGRAKHGGGTIPGKVHPSHGVLYIPFDRQEIAIKQYEVLCYR